MLSDDYQILVNAHVIGLVSIKRRIVARSFTTAEKRNTRI